MSWLRNSLYKSWSGGLSGSLAKSFDLVHDGIGRGRPDKRLTVPVVVRQSSPTEISETDFDTARRGPDIRLSDIYEEARLSSSSSIEICRILNFCTLPVTVVGNSVVNLRYRGIL